MSADAQNQCSCVFCFVFLSNAVPDQLPVTPVGSFDKDTQPLNKSIEMVRIYFFFMNNFFKNSDFNFFTNKPSIFFDILRGKELYFSKRYHLSRLEQVFISKSHVKVIATVLGHAVCTL